MTKATGMFKELGLSQANAQKLVDFYAEQSRQAAEAPVAYYREMQDQWVSEIRADPEIGGKLDVVRNTVARAIDGLGDPKLASDFRAAMDLTGAGNNPAFIRAFYKLAQKVTEPSSHVSGAPPAQAQKPRTAASAIYPNLKSAFDGA
jgi:ribosomal protein L10